MRSGHLDDCFDNEEQEFLYEIVEPATAEAGKALQDHINDATLDDAATHMDMVERQRRKKKFYEVLRDALEV